MSDSGASPDDLDDAIDNAPGARSVGPSVPAKTSAVATAIAVVCAYELVAEGLNSALQEPILPSASTVIRRFRGRAVAARLAPRGARLGAMMGAGFVIGAVTRPRTTT